MDATAKVTVKATRSARAEIVLGFLHGAGVTFGLVMLGSYVAAQIDRLSYPPAIIIAGYVAAPILPLAIESFSVFRSYNANKDAFAKGQIIAVAFYFFTVSLLLFLSRQSCDSPVC